jgi:hypothetical protein
VNTITNIIGMTLAIGAPLQLRWEPSDIGPLIAEPVTKVHQLLVTNVVSGDNARGCRICGEGGQHGSNLAIYYSGDQFPWVAHAPFVPPTEKWTVTTVARKLTFVLVFEGETNEWTKTIPLLATTNLWRVTEPKWEVVK